jgi:hypothetical protein
MKKLLPLLLILSFNAYSEETTSLHCIYSEYINADSIYPKKFTDGDAAFTSLQIFPESKYVLFDSYMVHNNRKANYIEEGNSIKWAAGTLFESTDAFMKDVFELNRLSGFLRWKSYSQKPDGEMKHFSTHTGNCTKLEPLF